jgi:hypothetical protein
LRTIKVLLVQIHGYSCNLSTQSIFHSNLFEKVFLQKWLEFCSNSNLFIFLEFGDSENLSDQNMNMEYFSLFPSKQHNKNIIILSASSNSFIVISNFQLPHLISCRFQLLCTHFAWVELRRKTFIRSKIKYLLETK